VLSGHCSSRWHKATTTAASAAATVATRNAVLAPAASTILPATEAPTDPPTTNRTRRPGIRIAEGPERLSRPPGGGSVWAWAANSRLPTVARVNAVTTPLVAWPVVDRKVTRTGPTMKTNSSTTGSIASAVGSCRLPRSRWVQRTRIIEETGGMQAPETPADRKTVHNGQPCLIAARNASPETTKISSTGSSTRRWPRLSASRPMNAAATIGRACGVRSTCR
jgi:hypothetical protein